VKFTVLDALELGFKVNLIEDACRGVNLQAGDVAQAVSDMQSKGANLVASQDI
jgi:nicotinamidase/pyrazinamidase